MRRPFVAKLRLSVRQGEMGARSGRAGALWRVQRAAQLPTALILCAIIGMVAIGCIYFVRVGHGQSQSQGLQAAADSAALAGAQSIVHQAPQAILTALATGRQIPCGLGQSEAESLAGKNSATVLSYCYYPVSDRIEVTVQSNNTLESGRKEKRTATAALGHRLGPCATAPTPTPSPTTPTPTPSSSSPSPSSTTPPPDDRTTVVCGDLTLPVVLPGGGGDPQAGSGFDAVFNGLEPRLVQNH